MPIFTAAYLNNKITRNIMPRVIVIGAGFAGLSAAAYLAAKGHDVLAFCGAEEMQRYLLAQTR